MKMLRHTVTGEVWPHNPNLARHPDVEIFDDTDPDTKSALADAKAKDASESKAKSTAKAKAASQTKAKTTPAPKSEPAAKGDESSEDDDPLDGLDDPDD